MWEKEERENLLEIGMWIVVRRESYKRDKIKKLRNFKKERRRDR